MTRLASVLMALILCLAAACQLASRGATGTAELEVAPRVYRGCAADLAP